MRDELRNLTQQIRVDLIRHLCEELGLDEDDLYDLTRHEVRVSLEDKVYSEVDDIVKMRQLEILRDEVWDQICGEARDACEEQLMESYMQDSTLQTDVKQRLKEALSEEVRRELKAELRNDVFDALKKEMSQKDEVMKEVAKSIRDEIFTELRNSLYRENGTTD